MRIEGSSSIRQSAKGASPGAGNGFSLSSPAASTIAASGGLGQASALGAALALQMEVIDPDRRRRQVRRGEEALDAMEALALAMAGAGDGKAVHAALLQAREGLRERTGELGLDEVLAQIEQRAAVELAKLERKGRRGL